jgi:histone acetyltransferase (RNA polymerase elongator complex component)
MLELKAKNLVCRCIRCREVKDNRDADAELVMFIQQYEASNGIEYFISWENADKTLLYGMIRLRINRDYEFADPILYGCAMIRELHVYGLHSTVGSTGKSQLLVHPEGVRLMDFRSSIGVYDKSAPHGMDGGNIQHQGLGKKLINKAEELAYLHGMEYITVISGVGVKEYYRKLGFADYGSYLRKDVSPDMKPISVQLFHTMLYVIMALFIVFMALRI